VGKKEWVTKTRARREKEGNEGRVTMKKEVNREKRGLTPGGDGNGKRGGAARNT